MLTRDKLDKFNYKKHEEKQESSCKYSDNKDNISFL